VTREQQNQATFSCAAFNYRDTFAIAFMNMEITATAHTVHAIHRSTNVSAIKAGAPACALKGGGNVNVWNGNVVIVGCTQIHHLRGSRDMNRGDPRSECKHRQPGWLAYPKSPALPPSAQMHIPRNEKGARGQTGEQ